LKGGKKGKMGEEGQKGREEGEGKGRGDGKEGEKRRKVKRSIGNLLL